MSEKTTEELEEKNMKPPAKVLTNEWSRDHQPIYGMGISKATYTQKQYATNISIQPNSCAKSSSNVIFDSRLRDNLYLLWASC
jgi:hypothetical protein